MPTRERPFPVQSQLPGDDDTLVYKIFVDQTIGDSSYLVIGDTVFLSSEGIEILALDIGGIYGRDDVGQNVIGIRAVDPPADGDDMLVELVSLADPTAVSTATATVNLQANRVGEATDTYISITKDDDTSNVDIIATGETDGRVRISPTLNLLGAGLELCDIYITASYFVIKYNDSGTIRYKYLDLSGTGTTWVHSTSEPT
jgi:hypothetical protein